MQGNADYKTNAILICIVNFSNLWEGGGAGGEGTPELAKHQRGGGRVGGGQTPGVEGADIEEKICFGLLHCCRNIYQPVHISV